MEFDTNAPFENIILGRLTKFGDFGRQWKLSCNDD